MGLPALRTRVSTRHGPAEEPLTRGTHREVTVGPRLSIRWMAPVALATLIATCAPALAQPWSFTRVADTNTTVPGTSVRFQSFEVPSIDGATVGFVGSNNTTGAAGVYTGSGGALSVVADRQTISPGGRPFVGFGQ